MRINVKQAAERANVSPSLIYAVLRDGRLIGARFGARGRGTWRIAVDDFDRWLASCKPEAKPARPRLDHSRQGAPC